MPLESASPSCVQGLPGTMGFVRDLYQMSIDFYGVCIGFLWNLYGTPMGSALDLYGVGIGFLWDPHGIPMGSV